MPNGTPSRAYRSVVVVLLLACCGGVGFLVQTHREIRDGLDRQAEQIQDVLRRVRMTTYETSWRSGGQQYTVTTTCQQGESVNDCLQRHESAVAAMQRLHPPEG